MASKKRVKPTKRNQLNELLRHNPNANGDQVREVQAVLATLGLPGPTYNLGSPYDTNPTLRSHKVDPTAIDL